MILFLILLNLAGVGVAYYTTVNTAAQSITFFSWHWSGVPAWMPVAATALVFGGLWLLYMIYSGLVHGVRVGSMRRRVSMREQAVNDMRTENQRLREENSRLRAQTRGGAPVQTVAPGSNPNDRREAALASAGEPVDANRRPGDANREAAYTPSDRASTAPAFRPRPTFGGRVRAFFSGREPAGY